MELVTKTRTEHLSDTDKKKYKASRSAFQSFLGIMEVDERTNTMQVFGVIYYLLLYANLIIIKLQSIQLY